MLIKLDSSGTWRQIVWRTYVKYVLVWNKNSILPVFLSFCLTISLSLCVSISPCLSVHTSLFLKQFIDSRYPILVESGWAVYMHRLIHPSVPLIKITVTHRNYSAFLSLSRNSKLLVHWFLTNILWFYSITCHIIPLSLGSRHSCQLVREEQHAVPTVIRLIHGPVDEIELKLCFIFKPSSSYGRAISPAKHSRSGRIGHSSYPRLSEVAHGSSWHCNRSILAIFCQNLDLQTMKSFSAVLWIEAKLPPIATQSACAWS